MIHFFSVPSLAWNVIPNPGSNHDTAVIPANSNNSKIRVISIENMAPIIAPRKRLITECSGKPNVNKSNPKIKLISTGDINDIGKNKEIHYH